MKGSILTILLAFVVLLAAGFFSSQTLKSSQFNPEFQNSQTQNANKNLSREVAGESIEEIECDSVLTPETTEGPYYIANSPQKTAIAGLGTKGEKLTLEGFVVDKNCNPISNAWLDFWQADGEGNYDKDGYNLRGHQYTDSNGKFRLETVIPGEYPGRTPHIHVKVSKDNLSPPITTQLFIPGLESNTNDDIFNNKLEVELQDSENGLTGIYTFILED